jgi:Thrombospondin type 3 repeat
VQPLPQRGIMINNIPYLRDKISTFIVLSAAILMLLLASPLVLSNFLLQPVQATAQYTSVQTPNSVVLGDTCNVANAELTFDAQGSPSSGSSSTLTSGTFQVTDSSSGQILWSGDLYQGSIGSDGGSNGGPEVDIVYSVDGNNLVCNAGSQLWVTTYCTPGGNTTIALETDSGSMGGVTGAVDCGFGSDTTAQPSSTSTSTSSSSSSSATGTAQDSDSDGDGIHDSSDKCPHNSNPRCFKEGEASSTTTQQEQPSSNRTGNQTG